MSLRTPGLILNNTLRFDKHVNYLCNSCHQQLRNSGLIPKYINDEELVQTLINSRIDCGNALLYNKLLGSKTVFCKLLKTRLSKSTSL